MTVSLKAHVSCCSSTPVARSVTAPWRTPAPLQVQEHIARGRCQVRPLLVPAAMAVSDLAAVASPCLPLAVAATSTLGPAYRPSGLTVAATGAYGRLTRSRPPAAAAYARLTR